MRRLLLFAFGVGLIGPVVRAQAPERLSLERLYSLPRLIGTAPRRFSWSSDGRTLAFLWNDQGTNFRDIWTVSVSGARLVRMTTMPALPAPASTSTSELETLQQSVRSEREPGVTEHSWHPDGARIVMSLRGDLHIVTHDAPPIRRTETPGAESQAVFSPDGETLAYLLEGDIWIDRAFGGDSAQNLTGVATGERSIASYRYAPDSKTLAFVEVDQAQVPRRAIPDYLLPEPELVRVPRAYPGEPSPRRRLGVVAASGGEIRWIDLDGNAMDPIFGYRWSPDATRLLVETSDLYVKQRRVLAVQVSTGSVREVVRENNPSNVQALWQSEWSPDGNSVYFLSDRDQDTHIYRTSVDGKLAPSRITQGEWAVFSFGVFESGIVFVANEGRPEERHIFQVGLDGGDSRRVSRRPGLHRPTFSPNAQYAADLFSNDEMPHELFLTELASDDSDRERRITDSPLPEFLEYSWAKPEYVTFESHVDGSALQGRLTLPPGLDRTRKHPAILGSVYSNTVRNQWGGRTAHPTWGLDQYLVQEGYVLLNVDFRGSLGHGKVFREGIRLDYGGIDVEDLHSGVKYLESLGFIDMDRIGIWGSSYGGLLTCMSLFNKPGVYKAGVAGAPATNVWHALTGEMRVMMSPDDQPEAYAESSAYLQADGLQDHLMIIHGMRDRIVLFKDSVSLVQRLMLLGKDVDFVALPDSRHGWDNEGLYQTRFAFHKLVDHFERYLGKGPSP